MSACLSQSKRRQLPSLSLSPLQTTRFDLQKPSSEKKKKRRREEGETERDDDTREAGIIRGDTLKEIVLDVRDHGPS